MKLTIKITFLAMLFSQLVSAQYLHQQGRFIVDGDGKEFILRSMGLGGWMLQEGYMMESTKFANTQHELKGKIEQVAGKEGLDAFYDAWLTNYCQKEDVDSMAAWGFNAIRLPMHYNLFTLPIEQEPVAGQDTWLPKGFELVDSLLRWCEANHMYLILDLHAAPGGQGKDAAISDYDVNKPSLWLSAENRRKTVALWKKLAERYANEKWIGGYDLLNETNWTFSGTNLLRTLYGELTTAIRSVDTNHMLFIEGNWFANDFTGLTPPWDSNMAYSFHKYWSYNDQASIQSYLNMRSQYNVPLWLGEAGENSNPWFTSAIALLEKNKIGWAWWPYKKIGSVTGTVTIPKTAGYQTLLNYWNNGGTKPSVETAKAYLLEQAEKLKLSNCIIHRDVLDAMFRQGQGDKSPKPFVNHPVPGTIYATDYDLGGNNRAYFDVDSADFHVSTSVNTTWNSGYAYRNDAVDIESCKDAPLTNGYDVGWTSDKEWMLYTVDIDSSAFYQFDLRYAASGSTGKFHLEMDGVVITPITTTASTGSWTTWKTLTLTNVILQKGRHQIKLYIDKAGFNINYLKFSNPQELANIQPVILSTSTDLAGKTVYLNPNVGFDINSKPSVSDFSMTVNGAAVAIESVDFDPLSNYRLLIKISQQLRSVDNILLSYHGSSLKAETGTPFSTFENEKVFNNSPVYTSLPATIQAENYAVNFGLSEEDCTDTGGGKNMGYTNVGDYLDYLIYVPTTGTYAFDFRLASTSGGTIEIRIVDNPVTPIVVQTVTVPYTGGWQTWQTASVSGKLEKGNHTLRLYIKKPEFNINWFKVSLTTGINSIEPSQYLQTYPNPANNQLFYNTAELKGPYKVTITNMQGMVVMQYSTKALNGEIQQVDISSLAEGVYLLSLENQSDRYFSRFIKSK
ncbi:MAG: carbohydrate-binding protein [Candidatus Saccharibacteria bacterium]